jgi:hypothetical protein
LGGGGLVPTEGDRPSGQRLWEEEVWFQQRETGPAANAFERRRSGSNRGRQAQRPTPLGGGDLVPTEGDRPSGSTFFEDTFLGFWCLSMYNLKKSTQSLNKSNLASYKK